MLVAICGKASSGKDTIGAYLIDWYGFRRDAMADPIRRLVEDVFVLEHETVCDRLLREQPLDRWPGWTVRKLLQYIGTEMFREHIDEDVWVKSLCYRIEDNSSEQYPNWVVTDVRFPNEMKVLEENCKDLVSIKVIRDGADGTTESGIPNHASEAHDIDAEYTIYNNGSFDDLYHEVDKLMAKLYIQKLERQTIR